MNGMEFVIEEGEEEMGQLAAKQFSQLPKNEREMHNLGGNIILLNIHKKIGFCCLANAQRHILII
jgi:hypothetical protein